jgi:alkanesulfonate monooxygenase SsuD/methylene tetrahydromethanopterin reductase-like flavin-dependent oxidoreductase (luciferase family)
VRRCGIGGKRFRIDGLPVTPVAAAAPRLFLGGMAAPAIERAARLGDGFLSTGGMGHDVCVNAVAAQGQPKSSGAICAGNWSIIAADPEAEAARVGRHVLYQANEYIAWGAFGPPDQVPPFPDAAAAMRDGLYEMHDADSAVTMLTHIVDVHFRAQFPGEPVAQGSARIEYLARQVLPRVRVNLALERNPS